MTNPLNRPVEFVFRLVLGGLFVLAGVLKVGSPIFFLEDIRAYRILGDPWAAWTAQILPWLEIFVGIALILRVLYPGALLIVVGSMLVFIGATASIFFRGIDLASCGCWGGMINLPPDFEIVLQVFLLAMAVALALMWIREERGKASLDSP